MKKQIVFFLIIVFSFFIISESVGCTIFMCKTHDKVFVGNNEDWIDPNSYVWFLKAENGKLGRAYFGFDTALPQGGMNEKGLFFDCASVGGRIGKFYNKKEVYRGSLTELAMETCSTIEDVVSLFDKYDRSYMFYQILFADKYGNSVIIETDTLIYKKTNYQIATNFCQSQHGVNPYSFDRYHIADSMLFAETNYSTDFISRVLNSVHQEGGSPTQYSNIYDLNKGDIIIYLFHNYDRNCTLNIYDELKKGSHSYRISELLEASSDYENFKSRYHIPAYKIVPANTTDFNRFAGEYENDDFSPMKFNVTEESGELFLMVSGFNKYRLFPLSEKSFLMKELNFFITFEPKDNVSKDKISASLYGIVNFSATRIK